jgi:hypothetical protein
MTVRRAQRIAERKLGSTRIAWDLGFDQIDDSPQQLRLWMMRVALRVCGVEPRNLGH